MQDPINELARVATEKKEMEDKALNERKYQLRRELQKLESRGARSAKDIATLKMLTNEISGHKREKSAFKKKLKEIVEKVKEITTSLTQMMEIISSDEEDEEPEEDDDPEDVTVRNNMVSRKIYLNNVLIY